MANMGDNRNDFLLNINRHEGSLVSMMDGDGRSANLQAGNEGNARRAIPVHYGPTDSSGQAVWRPGLPAPVLCQNVAYGQSYGFAVGSRMVYLAAPPEVPPLRASSIDVIQSVEQQQAQSGSVIQVHGPVSNQGTAEHGVINQSMQAINMPSMQCQRAPPGFIRFQPSPSHGFVYNHQQGFVQHGSLTSPFQLARPGVAAMYYQNVAFYQSVQFRGPGPNVNQQMAPLLQPTIPNQVRCPTPQTAPQDSLLMSHDTAYRPSRKNGMPLQAMNPGYGYSSQPAVYFSQFQGQAQANTQVFERISTVRASFDAVDPSAYINASLAVQTYQPGPSTSTYPGTRRRGSRSTCEIVQRRAMCRHSTRPVGMSLSLNRSCEPVAEPKQYESAEAALAALEISCTKQSSSSPSPGTSTQPINTDVPAELALEKSTKQASEQTSREAPSPTVSKINKRSRFFCEFCKSNNETAEFYTGHVLKDRMGIVTCPVLRQLVCNICGATGDTAHTMKYCPLMKFKSDGEEDKDTDSEFDDGSGEGRDADGGWKNPRYGNSHNAIGRPVVRKF